MTTIRRSLGFQRYLLSLQYHGSSFLGFSYQGEKQETADERSVEGCLRHALQSLLSHQWENIQVSSRTDRGVHALKNTCHVDIRHNTTNRPWTCEQIHRGLNYYLQRQESEPIIRRKRQRLGERIDRRNDLRVLRVLEAPDHMPNPYAAQQDPTQPPLVDWNARFSATQRTYVYRILHSYNTDIDWMVPFEWDRAWRIHSSKQPLDVVAMQQAAEYLVGEHDFSSFRGKGCQRSSPIVTLHTLRLDSVDCSRSLEHWLLGHHHDFVPEQGWSDHEEIPGAHCQLVTIRFQGNAFLYRQVRNVTGCLVQVGRGRLHPHEVPALLAARQRALAPAMAPPHGLFLVDVQHEGIQI